jgi:hypothetical protein
MHKPWSISTRRAGRRSTLACPVREYAVRNQMLPGTTTCSSRLTAGLWISTP